MKYTLADWAPIIGAAAASALFCIYYWLIEMNIANLTEVALEQGKILWGSSSFVLNLAMIWCAATSSIAIHHHSNSFKKGQRRIIFLGFGFIFLFLVRLIYKREVAGRAASKLLENISGSGMDNVFLIINFNNMAATFVALLFVLAFVFISRGTEESSARSLAARIHWFNLLLYSGGLILATAVYEIYQLFQWGVSLYPQPDTLKVLASSVAVGGGLVFSSLLMLIVVPPAIRLNRQLRILMSRSAETISDFDPQKWLLQNDIESTPLRSLSAYVAVLLPAATGLLTKLPIF